MKYTLNARTIWEQGPREKQEDSIFPAHGRVSGEDRLFILCDGMGGHSAGEVASSTVCEALSAAILSRDADRAGAFSDDDFRAGLSAAYDALDGKDDGSAKKMGTTLTFLKLHEAGCTIAHIGDSRVYHIRPGKTAADTEILFQTSDHSLVNDLVRIGELTPEEAKLSKQKNVITRAMQPCMERRPKADLHHSADIRPGDYFMLCSDGILEQMEDDNLKFIFSDKGGDIDNKIDILIRATAQNHDNHSAIVVEITGVEGAPLLPGIEEVVESEPQREVREGSGRAVVSGPEPDRNRRAGGNWLTWVLVAALLCLGYMLCRNYAGGGKAAEQAPEETEMNQPEHPSAAPEGKRNGQSSPASARPAPNAETPDGPAGGEELSAGGQTDQQGQPSDTAKPSLPQRFVNDIKERSEDGAAQSTEDAALQAAKQGSSDRRREGNRPRLDSLKSK